MEKVLEVRVGLGRSRRGSPGRPGKMFGCQGDWKGIEHGRLPVYMGGMMEPCCGLSPAF